MQTAGEADQRLLCRMSYRWPHRCSALRSPGVTGSASIRSLPIPWQSFSPVMAGGSPCPRLRRNPGCVKISQFFTRPRPGAMGGQGVRSRRSIARSRRDSVRITAMAKLGARAISWAKRASLISTSSLSVSAHTVALPHRVTFAPVRSSSAHERRYRHRRGVVQRTSFASPIALAPARRLISHAGWTK